MILFLGTRPGKTTTQQMQGVACPYCEQKDTLTYHRTPNYFHLFWLPLFTVQTLEYAECAHCKKAYDKTEFSEAMEQAVK